MCLVGQKLGPVPLLPCLCREKAARKDRNPSFLGSAMRQHSGGGAYPMADPCFQPWSNAFLQFHLRARKALLLVNNYRSAAPFVKKRPSQLQGAEPNTYESDPQKGRTFIIGSSKQGFSSFNTKVVATL
jgi:hypothetical protein